MEHEDAKDELLSVINKLENVKKTHEEDIESLQKEVLLSIDKIKKKDEEKKKMLEELKKHKTKNELLTLYFKIKIRLDHSAVIKSVELLDRINKFLKPINVKINKDELTKFMEERGIKEEKVGQSKCFLGVEYMEENITNFTNYL